MSASTKIDRLRDALLSGHVMSPLRAWDMWYMSSSTYHREIWELRNKRGMQIKSDSVTATNGVRHSIHWIEKGTQS
jgi:hypothetical protein